MSKEIATLSDIELINVLRNSLYPGAADDSIRMVLGYCQAADLDPMQKPVHIVPIWDGKQKCMRDVVMPGIGLYRIQAARSGNYAGVSEPEFGPDVTDNLSGATITYPSWCKVVVRRLLANGTMAEFAATERWIENYATAGKDTQAPNAMWRRRPYAQLAKCAEAQALRKAFPEIGSAPTAEEMEGKEFEATVVSEQRQQQPARPAIEQYPQQSFDTNFPKWEAAIKADKKSPADVIAAIESKAMLTEEMKTKINNVKSEAIEQ